MQNRLFIVGSRGIPSAYGGFETFAQELSRRLALRGREVWVSCERGASEPPGPDRWEGVRLFYVRTPSGPLGTIVGDKRALERVAELGEEGDTVYLLGSGGGPFLVPLVRQLRRRGIGVWLNPDGFEWRRARWSAPARAYLRFAERRLLGAVDHVVCDAKAIRDYHQQHRRVPPERSTVIEYGGDPAQRRDPGTLERRDRFLATHGLTTGEYYTYVGRLVPDNNLELIVRGVLASPIERKLLICAGFDERDRFYRFLRSRVEASAHRHRIVFAGSVYDRALLTALRSAQFAYVHGHEVGGTNPALVEAMGLGGVVVALSTVFNREVLGGSALFFEKESSSFRSALEHLEHLSPEARRTLGEAARDRVRRHYNWDRIANEYERLLDGGR